jgi:hypothetical protein
MIGGQAWLRYGRSLVAATLILRTAAAGAVCAGDCGADGEVTVNELIVGVNIALGTATLAQCNSFDTNTDGEVTVNELIGAVNNALNGCPAGNFAGDYSARVTFDATYSGSVSLSAEGNGLVSGSLLVASGSALQVAGGAAGLSFTFPVGGVSVAVSGTYDEGSGGFEVSGSFVDANGQTVALVISGNLPGPTGSTTINVYVGSDPPFTATLSAGMLATPTPTPNSTPPPGNGPRIVYAGSILEPRLFVINVDGSNKTQITHGSVGIDSNPALSPDGTKVAYSTPYKTGIGIAVVSADGGNPQVLTTEDSPLNYSPAWSPDGNKIIFTVGSGDGIDEMNADGSNRHRLLTQLNGETYGHLSWSPDGSRIVFASTRPDGGSNNNHFEIWVMNADASGLTRLTNNDFPDQHPEWSPDGSKILFGSQRGFAGTNVYIVNPDGSGEAQLTHDFFGASNPVWSRDGSQIAYANLMGINVANANGSGATTVPGTNSINDFDFR